MQRVFYVDYTILRRRKRFLREPKPIPPPHPQRDTLVETLRQAFSYTLQFRNALFVIRLDDRLLEHRLFPLLIKDIALLHHMGIHIVIVPGARNHINRLLKKFGVQWRMRNGVRVSQSGAMRYIKLAASDVANRLTTLLAEHEIRCVIGNWVKARSFGVRDGIDYGDSGMVESVDTRMLHGVLEDNAVPILTTVGWGPKGSAYNVSADHLAIAASRELRASKVFFINANQPPDTTQVNVPEIIRSQSETVLSELTVEQAEEVLRINTSPRARRLLLSFNAGIDACRGGRSPFAYYRRSD